MNKTLVTETLKKVFSRIMEVESKILTVGVEVATDDGNDDIETSEDIVIEVDINCTSGVTIGLDVFLKNMTAILYLDSYDECGDESGDLNEMLDKLINFIKDNTSYDII